ncbi:MAG TPA: glycerol-3-phosphate 1-O-acyltransferase PlsY [Oscillospiraceae bacterium]|nr:glycerol-3-phosphate 1-O-acyltransferase PlsY [Oscillospiraceae bacterium]HPS34669.1 glycerol-3-phosphate 1-O-acyltransferase PlsY [Oscillospiraceae bacterium]
MAKYLIAGALSALVGYLLGSICFAVPVSKAFIKKDIRTVGSKNAGMTNVLRCVGAPAAVLTLLGDLGKAVVSVLAANALFSYFTGKEVFFAGYIGGIFAVVGHLFPVWFKFKGGKGVMAATGMMLAINPTICLLALAIFLLVFTFTHIISISSISAAIALPIINYVFLTLTNDPNWIFFTSAAALIAILVVIMHKENIKRLLKGTEKPLVIRRREKSKE